jgi:hypothetical protein
MSYMTSSDKQADYCQKTGEIPIKKDASNIADYGADGHYGVFIQEMKRSYAGCSGYLRRI